ncbi:hypothetical protein [Streptomyces uncialis]|uniref:hypothetical protein n=1 Tax=Streptomyces uncialis TaxID=1048205 RepID=UPI003790A895
MLRTGKEITSGLKSLWRQWRSKAQDSWRRADERSYIAYSLVYGIRSHRKGRDHALAGARALIESWEEQARAAASVQSTPARLVTVGLPEIRDESSRRGGGGFLDALEPGGA